MRSRRYLFLAAFISGLMTVALSALPADAAGSANRSTVPSGLAAIDPAITVVPSSGLADGDTVNVTATRVIPSADVRVIQCDVFNGRPEDENDCFNETTTVSDAAGQVSLSLVLDDVVYRDQPFGDDLPVLCRGDICRIFLVVGVGDDVQQVVASDPLEFIGSPATIALRPATDLRDGQPVHVSGTAYGAEGRTVQIGEKECIILANDNDCPSTPQRVVTATVKHNGTYAAQYRVRRHEDGAVNLDCGNPEPLDNLNCFITVTVLDANGNPDTSFGAWGFNGGYPRVDLSFRTKRCHP